jgi:cellulose synthase/poly-beta-1,6-N-acetylglucosamine synthase-like glycosyltransferase
MWIWPTLELMSPRMTSSSMTLICKTQTLCPNGIPWRGSKEKGYIFLSTLVHACCIFGDFVLDLTTGYMYYSIHFQHLLKLCFFLWCLCSSLWFLIHAWFPSISIKICQCVNKHILALKGDKKFIEFVLKPMAEYHIRNIHDSTQFCVKAWNDYDLDDLTCLTSHLMVVKI